MDTTPCWLDLARTLPFPRLQRDLDVDVAVIGGGLMGVTAAYLLKRAGRSVALVERGRCLQGESGHTTAHVTAVTDLSWRETGDVFGDDAARAVWDAGVAAIDRIVSLIRAEDIACDFRWVPGFVTAPLDGAGKKDRAELEAEAKRAASLGIPASFVEAVPLLGLPGVRFEQQALFHPVKYLSALLRKIPGQGGHVFEESGVTGIEAQPPAVCVGPHRIRCRDVVIATHNPVATAGSALGAALFQTKLSLYTTYAVGARVPSGLAPAAAFWDTAEPYHYLRIEPRGGQDYAILGGEDHKTGQVTDTAAAFSRLETRLTRLLPGAQVDHRWSGQVIETNDGLPFIGDLAVHQFGATGFAGNGMTFGTLGAMMAVDAITGVKNPWEKLFSPGRKTLIGGTASYLVENKDYPYYLLRDRLGPAEAGTVDDLSLNEGRVLRIEGRKVAAYRDATGKVTLCSPVCTHLKCIVAWNQAEQTWDCPCHGSRFKPTGEVISGPAEAPLEKLH